MASNKPAVDLNSLIQEVGSQVELFEQQFPLADFAQGEYKQHPVITLLTCADSRTPTNIFGPTFNRVFAIKNIGNQLKTNEGSVLYGLLHLRTPLMIVSGHTDCGAIKASQTSWVDEPAGIRNELSIVKTSLEEALNQTGFVLDSDSDVRFTELAELNVDVQISYLLANRRVAELVDKGELTIVGTITDLHNVYKDGYGKVYTININGQTDTSKLSNMDKFGWFASRAKRLTNL